MAYQQFRSQASQFSIEGQEHHWKHVGMVSEQITIANQ